MSGLRGNPFWGKEQRVLSTWKRTVLNEPVVRYQPQRVFQMLEKKRFLVSIDAQKQWKGGNKRTSTSSIEVEVSSGGSKIPSQKGKASLCGKAGTLSQT